MRKTRSTKNSKNKFHWNKVQRFSIRKFSFGVASCMIGAQFVLSGLPKVVDAAMVTTRNDKGVVTLYANRGESPYDADAIAVHDSINVDREIVVDVDWSSYSKTNPYVTVTYKYNGGFGASNYVANYGGSRPDYWFTTPVGAQEPSEIRLQTGTTDRVMKSWSADSPWVSFTNSVGSRYQTKEQVDSMGLGDDTKWERYNDTTQETGKTFLGDMAGMFNHRIGTQISDSPSDQGIFESFRTNTKSIYSDWDLARNDRITITAKYKVADPTLKNGRRTLDFGAGVKVGRALQQLRHFKVVTTEIPVLYQDKELFEPVLPERIGVVDTAKLTPEEKTLLKNKIWEKNQDTTSDAIPEHSHNKFIENVKEGDDGVASANSSISIADDGTATITYGDGTQDVIPGTSLVYEKPQIDNIETTPASVGDYKYLKNPHAVDNINNITASDVESARQKFFQVNGMTTRKNEDNDDVITAVGDPSKTSQDFVGTNLEYDSRTQGFAILRNSQPTGTVIPKADLFKAKPTKVFSATEAIEKGKQAIDNLTYLSPKEKEYYKNQLTGKTTQDDINKVVNAAIAKNSENEKAIEAKKRQVKDKINSAKYLTEAEKEAFRKQVDNQGVEDPANGNGTGNQAADYTKELLDKIGQQADAKNLENAKKSIKEKIDQIKDSLKNPTADEYKTQIDGKTTVAEVEKVLEEAEKQKSKNEAQKAQEEAEKLKEEYKKQIDQIPGLSETEKEEYKKQIDQAKSKDQLDTILNDAKAQATRGKAKQTIEDLPHLNKAQKDELKAKVDNASDESEVDNIVSIAQDLDSKMDSLQKLVAEAEKVKASDKYTNPNVPQEKKTAFDKAKDAASKVADKTTAAPENAAGTSEVATLIDNLAKAIKELTGQDVAVPVSKDALKAEIDLNKDDAVKKSPAYAKETDAAKKKAYDDALANAQKVYDKQDATQPQVDEALDKLQQARLALSGKAEEFTLSVTEAAEISKEPKAGESLTEQADKEAVKAKVTANGKALDDTYTVEYGAITEKDGKKVVPVIVTRDGVSKTINVEVTKKVEEFTLAVKDETKPAKISKVPVAGESLTAEDQAKVKEKVTANGEALKETDTVKYGTIAEKDGKKVVPVTVTRNGVSKTVDVPVEGTDAAKSPLNDPEKVKVNDVANLSEDEKAAVKAAVKKANTNLTDDQISVDSTGKVTVTYSDKSQNELSASKTVEAKTEAEKALDKAKEQAKADLTEAANKEKAEIEADTKLSKDEKDKAKAEVDKVKKEQEAKIDGATTPEKVAEATEAGKKAIDAVHKTDADKSTPTVTSGEVPVSVDPATDKKVAEADKKAITEAVEVPEGQPQPTDKQVKNDGAIVEGTGANAGKKVVVVEVTYPDGSKDEIEVPVRKATDKDKAKADLTKAADAEKAEIDEDNALSKKEKEALKAKVDELKAKHEENINNATSPEAIASATEKGKQEITAVHTPQDITETAKRTLNPPKEKVKVTDINHLTDEEKDAVKKAIVATNPSLEESEVYVDDKGNVSSPKGILKAEKVVVQALNKPTTPVVVADPNHLTNDEKEKVKEAVANANSGLNKDDITVDDKGNVTTKNGDKLLAKDVVTPALKKPTTPVVVGNPDALTDKEKEDIKDAVVAENPGLNKGDVTVNPDGSVTTPKGNLPKEDVVTTVLNKPNKLVEVENPNSLTVKEKEAVKEAVANANPGLDKKDIKVDDQGNVTTPKGNLSAKEVVTSTLKKPTTPVEVVNPAKLTDPEKAKVVEEIIKNNPSLTDKDIKVDDQGNVETPKGNLPSEDVVTPALKKPTNLVPVKEVNNLSDAEKEAVKDAVVAANPGLNKDDIKVDGQGNVKTPKGDLTAKDVVTPALKKPTTPVEVKNPNKLSDEEKEEVKKVVVEANPGLDKKDIKVDNQGNVETPKGNLPAGDVVTPVLNVPTKPIVVGNPESLTAKEKEAIKDAVAEANPGLDKKDITVDNQGNVKTPKGNLPTEYIVKVSKGESVTRPVLPELSIQDALVAGEVAVEKGKDLTDEDILKQLTLVEGVTAKVTSKPSTTETGTKEAEVELTLADGTKVIVKVPVKVYEGERPEVNDLGKVKEDAKKQVEEAAKAKIDEINKRTDLSVPEKTAAIEKVNKAKEDAKSQIENATSAGTAKAIGKEAADKIAEFKPEHDSVKPVDPSKLDEEKAKAIAEIEQAAKDQTDAIKNNKDLTPSQKEEAIKKIEDLKAKAIEDVRKATSKDEVAKVVETAEKDIKKVDPQPIPTPQPQPGNNGGNGSNQNAQANSDAVDYAKQAAKNILEEAARAKKAQLEEAGLSDAEKEELFAKVDAEKQAALDEIAKAKDVDTVKQLVTKAVAKIKAIQPARNAQDNQDSQDAQNVQNAQDAQNNSNSNPTSLDAANVRGQELPATGTGSEFVVFNAAAISILTGLGLAIPSKKKETEK